MLIEYCLWILTEQPGPDLLLSLFVVSFQF